MNISPYTGKYYMEMGKEKQSNAGIGLAIGVAIGFILGVMFNQIGLGIAIGAAIGMVIGFSLPEKKGPGA